MKTLNLKVIRIDGGTQARATINDEAVAEYAAAMQAGADFPPLTVFFDGEDYWLGDGFHRWHAYQQAGKTSAKCDVIEGALRDAILYSFGANGSHGLRRTNADKRHSVETMLADDEWSQWPDRKIAEMCGVSHPFVAAVRRPEVATKQAEGRAASNKRAVEKAQSEPKKSAPVVESDSSDSGSGDAAELLDDMQRDLRRAESVAAEFEAAMNADDTKAPLAAAIRRAEHAERRQGELMEDASSAKRRVDHYEKQLARCGRAVGVKDLDKVAPAVEAMAKKSKLVPA